MKQEIGERLAIESTIASVNRIFRRAESWEGSRLKVVTFGTTLFFTVLSVYYGQFLQLTDNPAVVLMRKYTPHVLLAGSLLLMLGEAVMRRNFSWCVTKVKEAEELTGTKIPSFDTLHSGSWTWEFRYTGIYLCLATVSVFILLHAYKYI